MIVVKYWVDPDEVFYLLVADGTIMEFESEEEAR